MKGLIILGVIAGHVSPMRPGPKEAIDSYGSSDGTQITRTFLAR
jgi:hypothetical protein